MLTLKIIDNGFQTVKEVKSVMIRPGTETPTGSSCLTYFEVGDELKAVDVFWGDIYVMNDNGKTVANYCLGHPAPIPGGIDTDNVKYCKV